MNPNATVRDLGTARAEELSAVYPEIIANYTFQHFDMEYYDYPLPAIGELWESMGGELWQLIEPCDGFHPNQIANKLFAEVMWGFLENDHPDWLGDENPYNIQIQSIFGDQGGYGV
jgi:acyloxyacyl hydrolase